jgi:hypothetical protein
MGRTVAQIIAVQFGFFVLLFLGEKFVQFYFQFVAAVFNSEGKKDDE